MNRLRNFTLLIAGLCMAGFLGTACDSGTQEPVAPEETAAPLDTGSMAERPADEIPPERYPKLAEGVQAEVPENFPQDVAIYPGAVPAQGKGASVEGAPMSAVQLMTLDSPERVYSFYVEQLEREGWTIEDREGFAEKNAITASKGDCTASMLASPTPDGGTDIFLVTECSP